MEELIDMSIRAYDRELGSAKDVCFGDHHSGVSYLMAAPLAVSSKVRRLH